MEYLIILLFVMYLVYNHDIKGSKINNKRNYYIIMVILSIMAGIRYRMAPDSVTFEYEFYNIYPKINEMSLNQLAYSRYPFGWYLLNCIFYSVGSYTLFQLFCAFVSNILVFRFIRQVSLWPFTVVLFYYIYSYCYLNMDVMREFLAVSLELYAMSIFFNNRKQAVVVGLIGPLIHSFSIFFYMVLLLMYYKPSYKMILIIFIIFVFFSISFQSIIPYILEYFPGLSFSFAFYAMADVGQITILGYMTRLIVPIALLYILKKCKKRNSKIINNQYLSLEKSHHYISILIFTYAIIVIIRWNVPYIERFFNYYLIINYIIFAHGFYLFYNNVSKPERKMRKLLFIILFCAIPHIKEMATITESGVAVFYRYYPYNSIFERGNISEREQIIIAEQRVYD